MRARIWLPLALTALVALGCSDEPASAPPPVETGTPSPPPVAEEPPPPADVEGEVTELTVTDLSTSGSGLYRSETAADARVPVDQTAVDAAVDAAVAWADAHLTDVQSGGPGLVEEAGLTGDATPVSAGFADPDHPVTAARYVVTVGARGVPEWVRLAAVVDREDGEMTATFVFAADGGEVSLVGVHVGNGTPVTTEDAA